MGLALLFALAACSKPRGQTAASTSSSGPIECRWDGTFKARDYETLLQGGRPVATFTGNAVTVRVARIDLNDAQALASVVVRAPARGPALVLTGQGA